MTSDQTEAIFENASFIPKSNESIKLDDLIESKKHFKLFDFVLDNVDALLTKEMIIEMNKILNLNFLIKSCKNNGAWRILIMEEKNDKSCCI